MRDILSAIAAFIKHKFFSYFIFLIVVDDKGGVGKSIIAQICGALLKFDDKYIVKMVDTDFSNSTTAQITDDAKMLNLGEKVAKGVLITLLRAIQDKLFHHIVMDVGAREEKVVRSLLSWLVGLVRQLNGRVVILRPITLGSHNQSNAATFMDVAEELGLPVVFVRNEGQGRRPEYFDRWISSKTRAQALERGAVETVLEDANVFYADEAAGFGLSIAECAMQDFSRVKDEDRAEAEAFFNEDVAAFLNEWLRGAITGFGAAIEEAIAKRDTLDAARLKGAEDPAAPFQMDPVVPAVPKPKLRKS